MIQCMYSLLDRETGFLAPFLAVNDDRAKQALLRSSLLAAKNDDVPVESFRDFDLYLVASFDDDCGEVVAETPIKLVLSGNNVTFYVRNKLFGEDVEDVPDHV